MTSFITALATILIMAATSTSAANDELVKDFVFKNADIQTVVDRIAVLTHKNFIIDPSVRGKITITNNQAVTVPQAYEAFLAALALNSFATSEMGSYTVIRPARNTQRDGIPTVVDQRPPNTYQMMTLIMTLKYQSVEEVSKNLRILPSKDGELTPDPHLNRIIITDFGTNLNRVWVLLKELDQSAKQASTSPIKK